MFTAHPRTASVMIALLATLPVAALATARPFTGPSGWDHTVASTPSPQSPRSADTWRKGSGEIVTAIFDGSLAYDDMLAAVHKNIADNSLKPAVDRDLTCGGSRAHEVEMTFGTTIVNQVIVDDAPGVTRITYSRPSGTPVSADETKTITAYCGAGT